MYSYEVGKRYPFAIRQEGVVFDLADDGAYLNVYFRNPENIEVEQFKSSRPFEFRYVVLQNIAMCLFHIGSLNWMDAPYSPHLSNNLSTFSVPSDGNGLALTICLFDCATGELRHIRYVSLSTNFTKKFFGDVMELKMESFSEPEYFAALNSLFAKYSTKDLLKLSSPGFKIY